MMKATLIFIILILAGNCFAWSTSGTNQVWPAWQYPRSGRTHATECYAALKERRNVSFYVNHPPGTMMTPAFYRSQYTMLTAYKRWAKAYLNGAFVIPLTNAAWADEANKNTTPHDYYSVQTDPVVTRITTSNVFIICKMPTNYLDYTPPRSLNGLGGFTNDASVGHPHGFTNEATAAGGTNFPTGRSVWYTTDYGWDGLKTIINMLVVRESASINEIRAGGNGYQYGMASTWGDALNAAYECPIYPVQYSWKTFHASVGDHYHGPETDYYSMFRHGGGITGIVYATPFGWDYPVTGSTYLIFMTYRPAPSLLPYAMYDPYGTNWGQYDDMGSGYNKTGAWGYTNAYGWQQVEVTNAVHRRFSYVTIAEPKMPELIPDEPNLGFVYYANRSQTNRFSGIGWGAALPVMIIDYRGTNGFKYK